MEPWYLHILASFLKHPFSSRLAYTLSESFIALLNQEMKVRSEIPYPAQKILKLKRAEKCVHLAWRSIWGHIPTAQDFEEVK